MGVRDPASVQAPIVAEALNVVRGGHQILHDVNLTVSAGPDAGREPRLLRRAAGREAVGRGARPDPRRRHPRRAAPRRHDHRRVGLGLGLKVAGPLWALMLVAVLDAVLGTAVGLAASALAKSEFQAVRSPTSCAAAPPNALPCDQRARQQER